MKFSKNYLVGLFLLGATLLVSCNKDDDGTGVGSNGLSSTVIGFKEKVQSMQMPKSLLSKTKTNEGASQLQQKFEANKQMISAITSQMYTIPEGAKHSTRQMTEFAGRNVKLSNGGGTADVWTWDIQGFKIEYVVLDLDKRYNVLCTITAESYDLNYIVKGYITKDGSLSHLDYILNGDLMYKLDWKIQNNIGYFTMVGVGTKYVSEYNFGDYSGNLKFYMDGKLYEEGSWTSSGTGYYKVYSLSDEQFVEYEW